MTGDEQINTEADSDAAQPEHINAAPPAKQTAVSHEQRNQWLSFAILVVILLGTVLIIALLRPLIFGHIIPAVMSDTSAPQTAVNTEAYPAAEEIAPTSANEVFIPAASGGGPGDTVPTEPSVAEETEIDDEETAVGPEPTPAPVTHTVQPNDNLTKISQQYSVPVADIMAANNLVNADYISVGQVLIIPTN